MRRHRGSRTRGHTNDRRRVIIERLLTKVTINDKEQIILALLQQRVKDDAQASRYISRKERIKKSAGIHSKDTYNEDFNFDIVVYTCKRDRKKKSARYKKGKKGKRRRVSTKTTYTKTIHTRFSASTKSMVDARLEYPSKGSKIKYVVKRVRR